MYQDNYGFMWFGTYDGLNLYDGKNVVTFRFESGNPYSLSGNSIHRIMQADKDHLWIATQIGLDKFSLKERKVVESNTNYKKIGLIAANSMGDMWLISKDDYLTYYNGQQKKFHEIYWKGTYGHEIKSMFVDENEQFCMVKRDGILQFITLTENSNNSQEAYRLTVKEKKFHDKAIHYVFYEDKQICFIDEDYNLFIYNNAKDQKIFLRNLKEIVDKYGIISSLCFFQNDIFIAFIYRGLVKLNMADIQKLELVNMTIGVFSLLKDKNQEAMWVATDGRGVQLYYKEKDTFGNILLEDLPFTSRRPVRAIYTDEENSLWIGTKGDGIIKIRDYAKFNDKPISKNNVEIITSKNGQYQYPIYRFLRSKFNDDNLWIGADKLSYYSYKDNTIYSIEMQNDQESAFPDDIHTLCEVDDSTLWVSSKGLYQVILDKKTTPYKIKRKEKQIFLKDGSDIDDFFYSIAYNGDSILALGSRLGYGAIHYNIYNKSYRFVSIDNADNKGLGDAICLYTMGDSILYIGASSGLTQIRMVAGKDNEIKQFGRKNGIINDMIHGILEDNTNIIWLSTNKGLVKYNPLNDSFFNAKSLKIKVSEFADNACWHCPFTNRLFFGGVNGITWIEPKREQAFSEYEPNLLFTELSLYGKEQTLFEYNEKEDNIKNLILQSNQNTFQISFSVLDYINGENYDYSYMLENYDTDWITLQKENHISFTKLPPGEYILKVKYKNDVVNADNKIYSLPIVILPPWYLSRIAFVVYILLLILSFIMALVYVRWRFRKKQEIMAKRIKREQKEKLYESKMKFFTNITHELYTPLTLINGALSQINKAEQVEQIRKYSDILQGNILSLNELIQEILDYRKIEEGYTEILTVKKVSVTNLMNTLLVSFSPMITQSNIDMEVSVPENLYWYTDKSSLKKIISNLLSNAFKYTPEKGKIKTTITVENENLKIVVYNTGKGIEEYKIRSIFNRYQVLEDTDINANNQMTARNGLGLSICYSMAKLLGGELSVKSEVDQYAEFTVYLPKLNQQEEEGYDLSFVDIEVLEVRKEIKRQADKKEVIQNITENNNSNSHILIIDDNREIIELLNDILSPQYDVLRAFNVAEALQILKKQTPSLIITDIMMPETDGLSFIKMLREDKYNKHLPIIALSAKVDDRDVIKGYETGADTYITKPFSADVLLSIVDRFLMNRDEIKSYYDTAESAFEYTSGKLLHIEDRKFVEALFEIVKENINNPELGSEFIADKMKMPARSLYRQLKKVLSISLRDFIKDYRLSYAARLLITTNLSVKEIIGKIGFSNKSYFYNEFFKKYNVSPKQFKETNIGKET